MTYITQAPKLVSVIVLNLNGERIIQRCLDHLLVQTYPNFEIIVVDNGSTDGSLAILENYLKTGNVSVIKSTRNVGCPGGRNLGLRYARGEIIAFIDNDGYAESHWLDEVARTLDQDQQIGAVASVVFFAGKKIILNGAGGTLNLRGYGGDFCFNAPYEFAEFPNEVLYPMGCGMAIRKSVMDRIGYFDSTIVNYYDDVELGIRVWKLGFRVVVAPDAWIDHELSFTNQLLPNKVSLCERGRVRTVLKYYPLRKLPSWVVRELRSIRWYRLGRRRLIKAWLWNMHHIGSALAWRIKLKLKSKSSFWHLVHPSWKMFPPPVPNNQAYQPDVRRSRSELAVDGVADNDLLNFGWYFVEQDGHMSYRWTDKSASALLGCTQPVRSLTITYNAPQPKQRINLALRILGEIEPIWKTTIEVDSGSWQWQQGVCPCDVGAGLYELVVQADENIRDSSGRILGVAVASIALN